MILDGVTIVSETALAVTTRRDHVMHTKRTFELPMMLTFVTSRKGKTFVAHSLDFDIVSVARSAESAMKKNRLAVKTYVEFGLSNDWKEHIRFPAPKECWERLNPDCNVSIGPPIIIDGEAKRVVVVGEKHELAGVGC